MCESEFSLIKQAAAERLGVSPERLRIKFISRSSPGSSVLNEFTLFYLVSVCARNFSEDLGITFDDDFDIIPNQSAFNVFLTSISCENSFYFSGYSFEVV